MSSKRHSFVAQWDDDGVYFYQAYNHAIADWAITNQRLGGPSFNPDRMTWMKPSFAWMLYRSGYATKSNQERILKIKLSHQSVSKLLCACSIGHGGGGSDGRIQWDPARSLMASENGEPKKCSEERAIQIGIKGPLSRKFVADALQIVDVTPLAKLVEDAHRSNDLGAAMDSLRAQLPDERAYIPRCTAATLDRLNICSTL